MTNAIATFQITRKYIKVGIKWTRTNGMCQTSIRQHTRHIHYNFAYISLQTLESFK